MVPLLLGVGWALLLTSMALVGFTPPDRGLRPIVLMAWGLGTVCVGATLFL